MEAIDWRKQEFEKPMDKHTMKVVLGNETVGFAS